MPPDCSLSVVFVIKIKAPIPYLGWSYMSWDTSRGGGVDGFSVLITNVEVMNHAFLNEILVMASFLAMRSW